MFSYITNHWTQAFSSVALSYLTLCDRMNSSTPGPPVHHQFRVHRNPFPLSRWCQPIILSSVFPFSCPQSFPATGSFQMSQLFTSGGQSIGVSASTSVFQMNAKHWSPLGGLVGSPCSPRDSQGSSPTPQFKSINSSALSFFFFFNSPILTSIHNDRQNHSLD